LTDEFPILIEGESDEANDH